MALFRLLRTLCEVPVSAWIGLARHAKRSGRWAVSVSFLCLGVVPAWADDGMGSGVALKGSGLLVEQLSDSATSAAPSFVFGHTLYGVTDVRTVVEGDAELRRHNTVIRAERLELEHASNDAIATGKVRVVRNGNWYEGPELHLNLDTYIGFFSTPQYRLLATQGGGYASRVDFQGERYSVAYDATYTTCPAPSTGPASDVTRRAWWIQADRLDLDTETDTGYAHGGALYFQGVPILAAPHFSFPLSDKRRSGLLPPIINLTNRSGLELAVPYYWNIAPNLDATFTPTLLTKRGVELGTEVRYLEREWKGENRFALLPGDKVYGATRWSQMWKHEQALGGALPGLSDAGLRINLNRVSDDDFWKDLPRAMPSRAMGQTQRLLPNDVALTARVGAVGLTAGVYTWQTLQDVAAPIVAPYDRKPQVEARWGQVNQSLAGITGLDWSVFGQATHFTTSRAPSVTAVQADVNGTRLMAIAQIKRTWQAPGWFFRPKAQWHVTQYETDLPMMTGLRTASRVLPTFSADGGLVFEREAAYFGRDLFQTLEPRAMYVYTPYRQQSHLPNYDSAAKDFNIGAAWTENAFGGNDRISDTHALTAGVASRLIDPTTGAEAARLTLAQRLRFADQLVTLPGGTAVTDRVSDVLLGASINWDPKWVFESAVQFNPNQGRSQRTTVLGRYHPQPFHVLSAAYRVQRAGGLLPASEQVDLGWQWPLSGPGRSKNAAPADCSGTLYGVGRMNYSVPDRKVVDLISGFEYDAGCWIGRLVLEQLQVGTAGSNQRILFQLEFNGFTRVGSNPLQTLRNNVPKYMPLNERTQVPSRFGTYE